MRLFHVTRIASVLTGVLVLPGQVLAQSTGPAPIAPVASRPSASPGAVVPADYVIGAEDVLGVLFWREQDISGDVTVRPDGAITLPLIGEIQAAGKRPGDVRAEVQSAAERYFADANVTVVVRQVNSRKVYITGQVATPGAYPLTGPRTVMQLIALAGGVTEYADTEGISVMRQEQGRTRSLRFNYKDVAKGKKLEQNILLQPGDTVVVP